MSNIQTLDTTDLTTHDIALAAFHDGLATDYSPIEGESGYWIDHPTDSSKFITFDLYYNDEGQVDGWTYTTYEHDGDDYHDVSTGGAGLAGDETVADLLDHIATTLTEWAKN